MSSPDSSPGFDAAAGLGYASSKRDLVTHTTDVGWTEAGVLMVRVILAVVILFVFLYVIRILRGTPPSN
jgi:hypothetical protein